MIKELLAQIEGDEKKLKENARPKLKEPIISREAAKSLGVFCLNEFLYDKCRFGDNCRFGHGLMADIKACKKCCKFVLMDNCKFGENVTSRTTATASTSSQPASRKRFRRKHYSWANML